VQANQIIHNYRLLRFIAQGGMGEVWQAEHLYLNKTVAIKRLHPSLARDAAVRRRFKQEATTLAYLDHPNIVRLHDYLEDPTEVYLVMEYVEGIPLDEWITKKTGPIPEPRAADLLRQILDGVGYAHQQGIIHRDIKPNNFLITPQMEVKILDFGIAHAMEGHQKKLTKTGARLGTVLYMSPEQVQGLQIDFRSDIYAVGVTLFQMLTGQCPYRHDATEFHVFDQIVNHPLPRAASFYPMVSPHMQYLIDRATAKFPQYRFQSCQEFFEALIGGSPVAGAAPASSVGPADLPPDPVMPQKQPATKEERRATKKAQAAAASVDGRHRRKAWRAVFLVGLVVLLLAAGFVGYFVFWKQYQRINMKPEEVAREFLEAVEAGKYEKARLYGAENCGLVLDIVGGVSQLNRGGPSRELIIEDTRRVGLEAIVRYHFTDTQSSTEIYLNWDSKGWAVDCSGR
jgi:tRNA A-37 threonylcarbamoyl transferase component Bud32